MWIQTSYNTRGNKYYNGDGSEGDQSKKLRGNYAGIGYTYDEDNDIFWSKTTTQVGLKIHQLLVWDTPITYPNVTDDDHPSDVYTL